MEKNEHAIFGDIPTGGKYGKFHSAVLTTYAIDLIHFDNQLLNLLRRKQICSINIFADEEQVDKAIEYVNPQFLNNIGKDYSITTFDTKGAFHPKINFFVGDDAVMMLVGSGNLTVSGHGKNHETFTGFILDENDENARPLVEECWRYLLRLADGCGQFEKNRLRSVVPENCLYLDNEYAIRPHEFCELNKDQDAALLYHDDTSILSQISRLVPVSDVTKITVLSPFYDEEGDTLVTLAEMCPNAKVDVLIQPSCTLPPNAMKSNSRVSFYDFDETNRGKVQLGNSYKRQLHAKVFHFKTNSEEYCIIGSANATVAALGSLERRGINEEFCVLYRSKAKDFMAELGLKKRKPLSIDVRDIHRESHDTTNTCVSKPYHIISASYENGRVSVLANSPLPADCYLMIDNGSEQNIVKADRVAGTLGLFDVLCGKETFLCNICNINGEQISNKTFLHWLSKLEATNPSQTSRSLNRFISQLESTGYEGLEVTDILSDIMYDLVNETEENETPKVSASGAAERERPASLPDIKYQAEFDNDDVQTSRTIKVDRTSRLLECIEESFRRKMRSMEDEKNDEEEEGNAEESNERTFDFDDSVKVKKTKITDQSAQAEGLLNKYMRIVSRRQEIIRKGDLKYIGKDDLNFFSLTMFTAVEICYLNRMRYTIENCQYLELSYYQKKLYDNLDRCMNHSGLNALESFVSFCKNAIVPPNHDDDYQKVSSRMIKYAILYATLFYKNASEMDDRVYGNKILSNVKTLVDMFGLPTNDYLAKEYQPLIERYDNIFRMNNVDRFIKKLQ